MKALILAAGKGTRLKYLTYRRPKPMLPLSGFPLLQHTIEWLRDYGINEIALNLHHQSEVITRYFGNGAHLGVSLCYSYESHLMGTAGAMKKLAPFLDESFVVIYGDVYTNINLTRLNRSHQQHMIETSGASFGHSSILTMTLYEVINPEECGLVEIDDAGRVTRFVEKPPRSQIFTNRAFTGVMVCEPELLNYIPEKVPFDFSSDLVPKLLTLDIPLFAETIQPGDFVIDIGTLPGYLRALRTAATQKSIVRQVVESKSQ